MLIALLVVLGVDLIVIVAVLAVVLARRLWVSRQPGAFRGAIRVTEGEVPGLSARWRRGYGRWVREVLVWTKGPFLFRNELVAANAATGGPRDAPGQPRLPMPGRGRRPDRRLNRGRRQAAGGKTSVAE